MIDSNPSKSGSIESNALVSRLRDAFKEPKWYLLQNEQGKSFLPICEDAADEIERLRAALTACETHDYRALIEAHDAEVGRLRAIIRDSHAEQCHGDCNCSVCCCSETEVSPPADPPDIAHILDLLAWAHSKLRAFGVHTGKPESAMRMDAIELELRSHSI